jgi:DNA-binding transcriptional regulator YiaG
MFQATDLPRLAWVRGLTASGAARNIRLASRTSIPELARSARCSVSTIWRWENQQRVPHGDPALRYADTLEALLGTKS